MSDNEKIDVEVVENTAANRFEAHVDGELAAIAEYRPKDGGIVATHTETFDAFEGRGVASRLVGGMLDRLRADGRKLDVECQYVAGYLRKHPEHGDVVDSDAPQT